MSFDREGKRDITGATHKKDQTFRRGRAIAFLEKLQINRSTLQRQLQDPQFESIKQVISGELKATEMVIDDTSEEDAKSAEDVSEEGKD